MLPRESGIDFIYLSRPNTLAIAAPGCFCIHGPTLNSSEKLPTKQRKKATFPSLVAITKLFLTLSKPTPKPPHHVSPLLQVSTSTSYLPSPRPRLTALCSPVVLGMGAGSHWPNTSVTWEWRSQTASSQASRVCNWFSLFEGPGNFASSNFNWQLQGNFLQCIGLAKKIHLSFSVKCNEKPEWTFWPTQ